MYRFNATPLAEFIIFLMPLILILVLPGKGKSKSILDNLFPKSVKKLALWFLNIAMVTYFGQYFINTAVYVTYVEGQIENHIGISEKKVNLIIFGLMAFFSILATIFYKLLRGKDSIEDFIRATSDVLFFDLIYVSVVGIAFLCFLVIYY